MRSNKQEKNETIFEYIPDKKTPLDTNIDKNIEAIKGAFTDCEDVIYRDFTIGGIDGTKMFLFYIDGLADKILLDNFVMTPLMISTRIVKPDFEEIKNRLSEAVKSSGMAVSDFKEFGSIEEAMTFALSGETSLLIDGYNKVIIISTKLWPARSISEPSTEVLVRGPRDGFTETMRFNTALVRRRIRDPRFKIKQKSIGVRSRTDVAILYMDDIVDKRIVDELYKRINEINIDAILDSGYIEQFIEESNYSPFPQTQATERPDVVAAAIYEGRVAIIVDNSPFVLIIPTTLTAFFQSPEDYYTRSVLSIFIRILRLIGGVTSILAPAAYIAVTSFNPGIIPSKLALSIAASREGVPFPAFIEAIIMELTFELLREAGVRLPRAIGSTIGIVGGLVIGQAAVSAHIVSPIMVIVVAVTAIASFAIPNYELSAAFRLIRFLLMIAAAIYGLYGIVLASIGVLIHLANIKSFNVPYLSPVSPFNAKDMKDTIFRAPWNKMKKRPLHYSPSDPTRQGGNDSASDSTSEAGKDGGVMK
jgi:spore germination protein